MDDILDRFTGVRKSGSGWSAKCPTHDDRTASLSIGRGSDDRWLLKCHKGCTFEDIIGKVGLEARDLFDEQSGGRGGSIVEEYSYHDERDELLYQVCRFTPKDFRQRRPDGHGGWNWKLGDVRRVIYRLPELHGKQAVLVVEGEKDAGALWALGLPATTNAGGAGKWREEYSAQLVAAGVTRIVVLPDADTPGRSHARKVAASAARTGLDVKVLELPDVGDRGDVSDYLRAQSKAELLALIKAAPTFDPGASTVNETIEGVDLPLMTPQQLGKLAAAKVVTIAPYIVRGAITELVSAPKIGKTTFALYQAGCIVHGQPCLGEPTVQGGVVYLTEQSAPSLYAAVARAGLLDAPNLHFVSRWDLPRDRTWNAIVAAAVAACRATGAETLIIDTLPQWRASTATAKTIRVMPWRRWSRSSGPLRMGWLWRSFVMRARAEVPWASRAAARRPSPVPSTFS